MAKILSNRAPYYKGTSGAQGLGVEGVAPINGSLITVVGKAGDVLPLTLNQIGQVVTQMGVYVQSSAAVDLQYSLSDPGLAGSTDPDLRSNALWTDAQTLTANAIVQTESILFTTVLVTFTNDAEVHFLMK